MQIAQIVNDWKKSIPDEVVFFREVNPAKNCKSFPYFVIS
jgi:hypothetical protein